MRSAKSAQVAVLSRVFPDEEEEKKPSSSSKRQQQSESQIMSMRPGDPGVTNFSRKVYKARVVGVDPGKDIAVLKIDAPVFDLYPIDVGTSTGLKVGQSAFAIGNPFGLDHTLTVGKYFLILPFHGEKESLFILIIPFITTIPLLIVREW